MGGTIRKSELASRTRSPSGSIVASLPPCSTLGRSCLQICVMEIHTLNCAELQPRNRNLELLNLGMYNKKYYVVKKKGK